MAVQTRRSTGHHILAPSATRKTIAHKRHPTQRAKTIAPMLHQIAVDSLAQPKVRTRQFDHLQRAIEDQRAENPYAFVVVKGTSLSAFYQLERVVSAASQTRTTLSAMLNQPANKMSFDAQLKHLCTELRQRGTDQPDVLQLFWDEPDEQDEDAKDPKTMLTMLLDPRPAPAARSKATTSTRDVDQDKDAASDIEDDEHADDGDNKSDPEAVDKLWQTQLKTVHKAIAKAAPKTKLVIYTPKQSIDTNRAAQRYEVYDARLLGWNADEDGFALRAAHLSQRFALKLPESQLKGALRHAPFTQLEDIFNYAQVLGARQQDATHIEALREAARNFHDRGEDGKAYDNIVACSVDTQGSGQGSCGLIIPPGMREFTDVLKNFSMYQSVYTNASKAMVFTGHDRAAKIALIKDLAADTNALLVIPPTSDLLEMMAQDSEEEFEDFLNNVTQHANACGRSAIVYLGELDALLALGEKAEGTLGFNLVATQLSKLCDKAGRAPGWEDLVIVLGTQESVEYTCEPLANIAFQAKTCAPTALHLQAVMRSCLAQLHPAHALTDSELEDLAILCLKIKSPFHVDDVEQVLRRAARLAFCQWTRDQPLSIKAEHVREALEETHSAVRDASHSFYS